MSSPLDWGDAPVSEQKASPASWGDQPVATQKEGPGLLERLKEQSLPATMGRFAASSNLEMEQMARLGAKGPDGKSELERERDRRIKAGEKTDPATMLKWASDLANERVHGKVPPSAPIAVQMKQIFDSAVANPVQFGKSLLESAAAHPELWGPQAFVLAPLESIMEQQPEKGRVDWGEVGLDTAIGLGPAAVISSALHLGHFRAAAAKGAKVTPEAQTKAVTEVKAKVDQGTPPADAAGQVLDAMGVKPEERAKIVNDAKEVIDAQRDESGQVLPEAKGKEGEVQRGGDLPVVDRAIPEERAQPKEEEKVVQLRDYERRIQTEVEGLEGEEKYKALRDIAKVQRERQGIIPEEATLPEEEVRPSVNVQDIRSEIGWAETGGKIIRDPETGDVTGRTKWIPKSDFWKDRPDKGLTEKEAHGILDKLGTDVSFTPKERRFIEYAREYLLERDRPRLEAEAEAAAERAAIRQYGKIDPKLLGVLAAVGIGGGAAYAYTGDKSKAVEAAMLTGAAIAGIAIANRVGRAVRSVFDSTFADKRIKPMGPFNEYLKRPAMVEYATRHWERTTNALLAGIPDKEATKIKVRDWLQGHRDMTLTPREQAYADEIKRFLDTLGDMAHDAGTIERLRENYLTGLYQKKPFKNWKDILRELSTEDSFRGNYTGMSRRSRFNLQKVIPDYRTAEQLHAEGKFPLIPLTNDPVKIAGHYARSVQKTIAVNKLINDLKQTPGNRLWEATGIPVPVIIAMNFGESMGRIVKAVDQTARHLSLDPESTEAMKKVAMLDARSDYVMVKHPSLNGLLVHKDVAPMLKILFDTSDPGMVHRALYAASMAGKALFFTVSFFHPVALGVVAGTLALPRLARVTQIPKYWREIPAARAMLVHGDKAPAIAEAAEAGLEFLRAPQDMDPNIVSRILNYGQEALGPVAGFPLKAMRVANDWVQNLLWNELFPTLKLASFNAELQSALLKNPKGDIDLMAHQIAQGVNDMFGGQNWFNLANDVPSDFGRRLAQTLLTPHARRIQQIVFLSPDWNISAIRAWYEGMKSVLPGIDRKASDSMYRSYLLWSGMTYLGAANFLAQQYTGHNIWDQKDWTYVDRGDGTKIQLNKHYMEMAHLTMNPEGFFLNKLNILPKEALDQFFGKEYVFWNKEKGTVEGPPMEQYPYGLTKPMHAARSFVPLSIANIMRDPAAGLSGMFSFGIYGTPYKQREERAVETARAKGKDEEAARERTRKRIEREKKQKFKEASP